MRYPGLILFAGLAACSSGRVVVRTTDAPLPLGPYSQGVIAEDTIYVSGQGPIHPRTGRADAADVGAQTRRALENVKAIVEAAGGALADVAKCNVYLRDIADFATMNAVYATYFTSSPPARTTIQAAALPGGAAVEIECVARRRHQSP